MVLLPKESLTLEFVLSSLVLSPDHTLLLLKRLMKMTDLKDCGEGGVFCRNKCWRTRPDKARMLVCEGVTSDIKCIKCAFLVALPDGCLQVHRG